MSNYLKKILFTLLILVLPYMNSVSKAMDVGDYEGSTVRARKVSCMTDDQKDVQSFTKQSASSQVVGLEDSKNSWTSYLSSSVMSAAQKAYDIVDYTTRNPQKAAIIGLCLAYQVSATVAGCACSCTVNGIATFVGCSNDVPDCSRTCKGFTNAPFAFCVSQNGCPR